MAQPILTNGLKELNINKPDTFNGDREGFKKFLQDLEVYMNVNHETYNNNLRKITFILSFMTTGSAATWKAQFIEEAYAKPIPANSNDRLGTYTAFRKELIEALMRLQESERCAVHYNNIQYITRAECDWDVAALEDNC
jgi:Domain of unknown function (DUF4939)